MSRVRLAKFSEVFSIQDSTQHISKKVKDQLTNMVRDSEKSNAKVTLLSEIASTHAGIVNGNFGYYKPKPMKDSCNSWISPYPKPVLFAHNLDSEPLGRVRGAIWKSNPFISDSLRSTLCDDGFKARQELEGSIRTKAIGFIQNLVNVCDADAVEKVLDERFLTVSVHGSTDEMICSICSQDWLKDGMCEHRFGKEYRLEDDDELRLAYWIAGNFIWDELSFVNSPADPLAIVITKDVDSGASDVLKVYNYSDASALKAQVVDSNTHLLRLWAINDQLQEGLVLDERASIKQLDKIYGRHIFANSQTPVEEKGTVANSIPVETVETPTPAPAAPEASAVEAPATPPAETPTAAPAPAVSEVPAAEATPAPIAPAADATPAASAPPAEVPVAPPADTADSLKQERDALKAELASLKAENTQLGIRALDAQTKVREIKIREIQDLRKTLGLEPVQDSELQKRSIDVLDESAKDLAALAIAAKQIVPKDIQIADGAVETTPTLEEQVSKRLDRMTATEMLDMLFSRKFNPQISQ